MKIHLPTLLVRILTNTHDESDISENRAGQRRILISEESRAIDGKTDPQLGDQQIRKSFASRSMPEMCYNTVEALRGKSDIWVSGRGGEVWSCRSYLNLKSQGHGLQT